MCVAKNIQVFLFFFFFAYNLFAQFSVTVLGGSESVVFSVTLP